jgi:excisionase family DNA binding protein
MITVAELAEAVGVSRRAARTWVSRRPGLGFKVGGRRLVPRSAVTAYKRSQAVNRARALEVVPEVIRRMIHRQTRKVGNCRIWTGPFGHDGLPRLVLTQSLQAGRYAYVARHGPLKEGERVGSTCGNPRCLEHLQVQNGRIDVE